MTTAFEERRKRDEELEARRAEIKRLIWERADSDPGFAVAFAVLELVDQLDACFSVDVGENLTRIAEALEPADT